MTLTKTNQDQLTGSIRSFLSAEIKQLNEVMENYTSSNQDLIRKLAGYIFESGGKRIRPILTLICAKLFNYNKDKSHIYLATAVEFIHTATLLHDDVVDESTMRRGNDTANMIWGSKASILVGDYLFSQAFKLMSLCKNHETLEILSKAAVSIAEGEVSQLVNSTSLSLSYHDYTKIITGKTAELFAAACSVSGSIAGQDRKIIDELYKFGLNLGILFQITDDHLDYFATTEELGKNTGDDFIEGKITLPIILSYKYGTHQSFWEKVFNAQKRDLEDFRSAVVILNKENINTKITEIISDYYKAAQNSLKCLPESRAKEILSDILDFTVLRRY